MPLFCFSEGGETEAIMNYSEIIYFDNAATSYPKPQSVIMSALDCMENYCGNPGRGSHYLAMKASEKVYEAREAVAEMFGGKPENTVFTLNTTYALNIAIKGIMSRGGHMLISNMEHNSTLRPAAALKKSCVADYDVFTAYQRGKKLSDKEVISGVIARLKKDTKMLVCIHSSNICSYTLPIREIGAFCRRHGIIFAVDAAQSAGHIDIDMKRDNIDILCLPAHKGLYSPQGCGIVIFGDSIPHLCATFIEGGNGYNSLDLTMGDSSPEKFEGGTLCTPAIAGLVSGVGFVRSFGVEAIADHEKSLWERAYDQLSEMPNIEVYDNTAGSVLLFNARNIPADALGAELSKNGFCLRSGYHCAPLAHKALSTPEGGALRIGFGIFNTPSEVDALCHCLKSIIK